MKEIYKKNSHLFKIFYKKSFQRCAETFLKKTRRNKIQINSIYRQQKFNTYDP